MSRRNLVILGSTGSIGRAALEVVAKHPDSFRVRALAAHSNVDLLVEQSQRFLPDYLCLADENRVGELAARIGDRRIEILSGEAGLVRLTSIDEVDIVLNAVVGAAGLRASLETVKFGHNLALANKESLVVGGGLFRSICERSGAKILPIDSEHSAIWQALNAGKEPEIRSLILTSSGGPFRTLPADQFSEITPEQALAHPTWRMGPKITIDSATLANKGLEVIEAVSLFSVPVDKIRVVIHPQSIIHSMVEYCDSSVIAQLSRPDMRLPISYALFWPERVESDFGRVDWSDFPSLTFEEPDLERFPALRLGYEAARAGGTVPAVYNAANEVAVAGFLNGLLSFTEISNTIEAAINTVATVTDPDLDEILRADESARKLARQRMEQLA
ncbi:MAG: 1-deoxy-D-xylulose-5-phosphate reductoisomerase [Candidatus Zixiibacteriota bacterium]|nr:MAG: 1-deoxy-D-xylulose-5-phosphate reductoisomerase [candidate division Zixibacteria bacterium]